MRVVSVFFVLFTLAFTQARPHQGACLLLGVLFQFSLELVMESLAFHLVSAVLFLSFGVSCLLD